MTDWIRHQPCPKCDSSDAFSFNPETGAGKCFSCGESAVVFDDTNPYTKMPSEHSKGKLSSDFRPLTSVFHDYKARGISSAAVKRYGVDVVMDSESGRMAYYPMYAGGVHVGNKVRAKDKRFYYEGTGRDLDLFGQQAFPAGSNRSITVVEGQDDAMAVYEMNGFKYPCVSVHGAASAVEDCKRAYEYLDSFEEIVICFDRDEAKVNEKTGEKHFPGQEAAVKVASLFKPGKVKILTLRDYKDANDYLVNGKAKQFVNEWFKAPVYKPDGLVFGRDLLDSILNKPTPLTVPYPWDSMNAMTYGARLSELVLLMADTGSGKSSVIREMAYSFLMNSDVKARGHGVGMLMLEEPIHDTAISLLSIHDSKPYHLPDTPKTKEDLIKAHSEVLSDDRVVLYDSFGSNDIDVIVGKIRHMAALGCKYIFLDHLSIIVSDGEGDERKLLDAISTKIKTLTIELDIAVFCVIHTNRQGMARGSAGPEKVANIHLLLERDKQERDEWRRNVLKVSVLKNRFCGKTGPCSYLEYSGATGRLTELDAEEIMRYEEGGSLRDDERW